MLFGFDCPAGSSGGQQNVANADVLTPAAKGAQLLALLAQAPQGQPSAYQPRPWSHPVAPLLVTTSSAAASAAGRLAGSYFPLTFPNIARVRISDSFITDDSLIMIIAGT